MNLTIQDAIVKFLFHCKYEKNLNPKSIKAYLCDLNQFTEFLSERRLSCFLKEINKEVLKEYLQRLSNKKPKTIKRKIATMKAMFSFLEFDDELLINPFHKIRIRIKEPFVLPLVMTLNETNDFLGVLYKEKMNYKNNVRYNYIKCLRNIAVVELLFATGIRVSELCSIRVQDLDLNSGLLIVNGKGSKERTIQIYPKEPLFRLREYSSLRLVNNTSSFFVNRLGKPLSTQSVRLMIHQVSRKAGLAKKITPHTFRHTFATLLLEEGVDIKYIQSLLGHSSILTTQLYTHVSNEKQKTIMLTQHPRRRSEFSYSE